MAKIGFKKIISAQSIIALAALLLALTIITLIYQREKPFLPQQLKTAVTFSDVTQKDLQDVLFNASLNYLKSKDIMKGYEDGSFKPENPINRAEFMKILTASLVEGEVFDKKVACFKDIKPEEWYAKFVCYGKENNWVSGNPDGTFKAGNTIAQSEIVKIFVTAMGWNIEESAGQMLPEGVSDKEWYSPYLKVVLAKNAVTKEEVNPGKLLSRKEVATILFRTILIDTLKVSKYEEKKVGDLFKVAKIPFTPEPQPPTPEALIKAKR